MSYEIVKSIVIKDDKVFSRMDSNNVYPKDFTSIENPGLTRMYEEKGRIGLLIDLVEGGLDGYLEFKANGNKLVKQLKEIVDELFVDSTYINMSDEMSEAESKVWNCKEENDEKRKYKKEYEKCRDKIHNYISSKVKDYFESISQEKNDNKTVKIYNIECKLKVFNYSSDPLVMAIEIINAKTGEPMDYLTTNLGTNNGNDAIMGKGKSHVNIGNKMLLNLIDDYKLGKVDMRFGEPVVNYSGFNSYYLYDFNLDVLAEYDRAGVEEFKKNYDENLISELEKFRNETFGAGEEEFEF